MEVMSNEIKKFYRSKMSDYTPCKNCAFHNPKKSTDVIK